MKIFATIILSMAVIVSEAQQTLPLYTGVIPNSKSAPNIESQDSNATVPILRDISVPTITYFPAKGKSTGQCIVIFPGGGYWVNAIGHEGMDVAKRFSEWGITAFVVKYRIPDQRTMIDPSTGPLQDAQQAMLYVRANAAKYKIDSKKIGILGFSAGGHLASTLGTHYRNILVDNPGKISARPDFMLLIYPVISSDTAISHRGSFEKLLGANASEEQKLLYSNEKQVTDDTPPTFLLHATDDDVVPVENVLVMFEALKKHKVPAELHIYPKGGHGFGMNNPTTKDGWMDRARNWLAQLK
jgi:acetyl esterase/lipase